MNAETTSSRGSDSTRAGFAARIAADARLSNAPEDDTADSPGWARIALIAWIRPEGWRRGLRGSVKKDAGGGSVVGALERGGPTSVASSFAVSFLSKRARLLPQDEHLEVPIALYISQRPQTIPISNFIALETSRSEPTKSRSPRHRSSRGPSSSGGAR